jgi:hypothetical protein
VKLPCFENSRNVEMKFLRQDRLEERASDRKTRNRFALEKPAGSESPLLPNSPAPLQSKFKVPLAPTPQPAPRFKSSIVQRFKVLSLMAPNSSSGSIASLCAFRQFKVQGSIVQGSEADGHSKPSNRSVELGDATGPKLALLYWICQRSDKRRVRGGKYVIVIRDRGGTSRF